MDMLGQLRDAIAYIEDNLGAEIDFEKAAGIACVSKDAFLRFFSYMTGMTLPEYIRRRRLTLAADELREGGLRVIDAAVKYGWNSADAFSKAFFRQHGVTPSQARDRSARLRVYPPVSFHIAVKGAKEMDFRLVDFPETRVLGVSAPFDGEGYGSREALRHLLWSEDCGNVPERIAGARWNTAGCHAHDGVWYGVWQDGRYMIAREAGDVRGTGLEERILHACTCAAFATEKGGRAWEELPRLFALIEAWLPSSGYEKAPGPVLEVLHLWTDGEERRKNRYYEVWIPVKRKSAG
ncbi:MAG: AraC family transcriptional regulator [Clostridiales bacterium]|nr:AraC family transcriptional regulator [Clostridiales bacterium]